MTEKLWKNEKISEIWINAIDITFIKLFFSWSFHNNFIVFHNDDEGDFSSFCATLKKYNNIVGDINNVKRNLFIWWKCMWTLRFHKIKINDQNEMKMIAWKLQFNIFSLLIDFYCFCCFSSCCVFFTWECEMWKFPEI